MTPAEFLSSGLSEHTAASRSYPVYAKLSNSHTYGADLIINATGVDSRIDLNISGTQVNVQLDRKAIGYGLPLTC